MRTGTCLFSFRPISSISAFRGGIRPQVASSQLRDYLSAMADHQPSLVYTDQWPDHPELLYGHELAPNPGLRPFAPFRLYKTPVAPPYAKTRAEVEYAVEQQAWGERQLRLYATGPPPPAGGADAAEPASHVAVGVAMRAWLRFASSAWAAWGRVLWSAEPLWLTGYKGIETMVAGVAHTVNTATARMRGAYGFLFVVVSVCALLLALVVTAEGLLRLVSCYMHHPGHGLAQEPYYVLVRDVKSWAVSQPPKCA